MKKASRIETSDPSPRHFLRAVSGVPAGLPLAGPAAAASFPVFLFGGQVVHHRSGARGRRSDVRNCS
jgi:hypothetical protein